MRQEKIKKDLHSSGVVQCQRLASGYGGCGERWDEEVC
jgi:hypothetical protein